MHGTIAITGHCPSRVASNRNPAEPLPDNLDHFFRCVETPDGWHFQVAIVKWEGPHTPGLDWNTFRRWKRVPTEERLQKARATALTRPRFFLACSICHKLTNVGHMHDDHICQGCAERHLGVVH